MAASKVIGGIAVTISATTDKFVKGVNFARRALASFARMVKGVIFSMKGLAVAFAGGMFVKWTANQFDAISALGDLSDKTGVATEKLAGFQLAALESGIASSTLEKALTKLTSQGMTLTGWVEQTAKLATHQDRLNAAVSMFGIRGADMVRLTTNGAAGLAEAQAAAESLGLALDRKTVAGVDRAAEAFARFKMALSGIFRSLAAEIAPFVEVLSNKAFDLLAKSGAGKSIGSGIAQAIIGMTKFVADGIQKMVGGVLSAVAEFKAVIAGFRGSNSWLAGQMGMSNNEEENRKAWNDVGTWRAMAKGLTATPWSTVIQGQINDAQERAAEQAALSPALAGPGIFAKGRGLLGGLLGTNNAKNAKDLLGSIVGGVGNGMNALPGLLNKGYWAGLQFQANNWQKNGMAGAGYRGIAAQDPLSREGNSQRVRSLSQNQMMKLGQKQLDEQKKTRVAVEKIANNQPNRGPANLAGG